MKIMMIIYIKYYNWMYDLLNINYLNDLFI